MNSYPMRTWKYGGPFAFWIQHVKAVEDFILKHKLPSVSREHLLSQTTYASMMFEPPTGRVPAATLPGPHIPFPGGMRIAHLHFKGDLYLLNAAQWKEFSAEIIKGFQEKLSRAGAIGFEPMMEISEAMTLLE